MQSRIKLYFKEVNAIDQLVSKKTAVKESIDQYVAADHVFISM